MPFGLTNAPVVFQALINDVRCDMLKCLFAYLDDLIFSGTEEEQLQQVRRVLRWLLRTDYSSSFRKCEFHQASVSFLGYVFRQSQIAADLAKVKAVAEWPMPTMPKQLGFKNVHRRLIRTAGRLRPPCPASHPPFGHLYG